MINFNKYHKITTWKNPREKVPLGKNVENLEILELLDKGFYAQEINKKTLLSPKKLSRIINSFKSRKLIEQIQSYPKRYKSTTLGKLILAQGDLNQKRIQEFIPDKRILPKGIESVRVHKLRFKNKLVQKPLWLNQIRDKGVIHGLNVKRVELNNWTKFLIFFNYQDFKGLENIEVCNDVIIYNFNRNIKEQYVSSNKELESYFEDIIFNCKHARNFLAQKGFVIDEKDPEFCQKPHFAIKSNGDPGIIGTLGKFLNITIETPTETRAIDNSPPKEKGEEETDDIKKVKSYFDIPDELDNMKENISNMNGKINELSEIVSGTLNKEDLDKLEAKLSQMNRAMITMADGIQKIAETIAKLTESPEQETKEKSDAGSMYQ